MSIFYNILRKLPLRGLGCLLFTFCLLPARAQIGEYRNNWALGFNGGYVMSTVGFVPEVKQRQLGGKTFGITGRYVCEKYFSTICSLQAELNLTQTGWKEDILDVDDKPAINAVTGLPEEYQRVISYLQLPIFAHLAWGRERKGLNFFFQIGPQIGYKISEKTTTNFAYEDALNTTVERADKIVAQDSIPVQNSFDFGVAGGIGVEWSIPKAGHLQLSGTYYYGLGNIYGDSKKDYFSRSNFFSIYIKLAWLFDL